MDPAAAPPSREPVTLEDELWAADTADHAVRFGPRAVWRGLTALHPESLSASLSLVDEAGAVHRFHLSLASLVALTGALVETIGAYAVRTKVHSESSSGSPARAVSIPFAGEKV